VALWSRPAGGGFKAPQAALAEDCRGERWGKGARDASAGDREGELSSSLMKHRNVQLASKPGCRACPGTSLAVTRLLARRCPV
jgi:hypothetical protein